MKANSIPDKVAAERRFSIQRILLDNDDDSAFEALVKLSCETFNSAIGMLAYWSGASLVTFSYADSEQCAHMLPETAIGQLKHLLISRGPAHLSELSFSNDVREICGDCPEIPNCLFIPIPCDATIRGVLVLANRKTPFGEADFPAAILVRDEVAPLLKWRIRCRETDARRKMAEKVHRYSEQRFRVMMEASRDLIWEADRNWKLTYVSPQVETLLGYSRSELRGSLIFDFMSRDKRSEQKAFLLTAGQEKRAYSQVELFFVGKDGAQVIVESSASPIYDSNYLHIGFRGVDRDVTPQRKTENRLHTSEAINAAIVRTIPQKLALKDSESRFIMVNEAYAKDFGCDAADFTGKDDASFHTREAARAIRLEDLQVLESGSLLESEIEYASDGCPRWMHKLKVPVRASDGNAIALLTLISDITERKRTEAELARYQAELEKRFDEKTVELKAALREATRSNEELEQFAFVASHDLQEPLRKIIAFGNLLSTQYEDALDEKGLNYISRMTGSAARMQILIGNLLSYSRIATRPVTFENVSLDQVIAEISEEYAEQLTAPGVEFSVVMTPDVFPHVAGDALQLRQAFSNLVENAIKYRHPNRELSLKISACVEGEQCRVSVRDNGIGFRQHQAERIFGIFQRLHGRNSYSGTGIGLAICKRIVERHNGRIQAFGQPDEYAEFVLELPLFQHEGQSE